MKIGNKPSAFSSQSEIVLAKLIASLTANANQTQRVRIYSGRWISTGHGAPEEAIKAAGKIITLLDDQARQGKICQADESLLIHSFETSFLEGYCNIGLVIKPSAAMAETAKLSGKKVDLAVNCVTTEVVNITKAFLDARFFAPIEIRQEQLPSSISYGHYKDYQALVNEEKETKLDGTASVASKTESNLISMPKEKETESSNSTTSVTKLINNRF